MTDNKQNENVIDREPILKKESKVEKPRMFKCVLLNDSYTTFEFVVEILKKYFHHNEESANYISLEIHQKGRGIAYISTFEICETKAVEVIKEARQREFPLQILIEPEENN